MHVLTNGIFIATIAHVLIGISLVWDKILLQRPETKSLPNYVFWLGGMSVFGILLAPFGFHVPSLRLAGLAFGAGVIHLGAIWFYYRALKRGEASQTLAVMGGFSPLATAFIGMALLSHPLGGASAIGFALLVGGGFVMLAAEDLNWRDILPSILNSAVLFGLANVLEKLAFEQAGFITAYVLFTIGTFAGAMGLLIRPVWRRQILQRTGEASPRSRFWYFVNRFISGVGSFLIFVAISRASPAIVDAISGLRYVIIFAGVYLVTRMEPKWLQEDFHRRALLAKSIATALVVAGLVVVGETRNQAEPAILTPSQTNGPLFSARAGSWTTHR